MRTVYAKYILMDGDLKLAFVQKVLQDYMQRVVNTMRKEIIRRNVRVTDDLLKSLSYKVYQQQADGNAALSFAEWGRMVDMGVGRGNPLSGLAGVRSTIKGKKGRKPKKIYSPIAYGQLNGLMGDLLYGFTEETKTLIKNELNANTQPG